MAVNTEGLISIIVPVYNVEQYFEKCADSIVNQTHKNLEIIFINDGSTDSSGEICDKYAASDPRVTVIHQQNAGMSVARNRGLEIAGGEYIGFVDSDDFIDRGMFQALYDKAAETGSDIVECNFHHTYKNGEDTEAVERYYDKKSLICLGRGVPWNKIYRRALIEQTGARFPPGLYYEDMEFYIKLIPFVGKYSYVDIAPYHYVQRASSVNNYSTERTKHVFQILKNINAYFEQNGLYEEYSDILEFYWARVLLCSSFSRMCAITDASARKGILRENWEALTERYPEWRGNPVLRGQKSKQAVFMRSVNAATYRIYSRIFPAMLKVKLKFAMKRY